jgi:hypothetical protein
MKVYTDKVEEVTTRTRTRSYIEVDNSFTQVYDSIFTSICKLKGPTTVKLLFFFLSKNTGSGIVTGNSNYKEFARHLNVGKGIVTRKTYYEAIKEMVAINILLKGDIRGHYILNPVVLWKGTAADRKEVIEVKANKLDLPNLIETTHTRYKDPTDTFLQEYPITEAETLPFDKL